MLKTVFVFLVFVVGIQGLTLEEIKDNIIKSKTIDKSSVGVDLSGKISISIHVSQFVCTNISATLTSDTLTVTANTKLWNEDVYAKFYFYYISNQLELSLDLKLSAPLSEIYTRISRKASPSFLLGLKGKSSVSFLLNTGGNGIVPQGITIAGSVLITNGTLLEAVQLLHPGTKSLQVDASAFVPVYTFPTYIDLKLKEVGSFSLTKAITVKDFTIELDFTKAVAIELSMDTSLSLDGPNNKKELLDFTMSADFETSQKTAVFSGSMQGRWIPFDLKWLTITSALAKLEIGGSYHFAFSLSGVASVSWGSSPVTAGISVGGSAMNDILIYVDNVPIVDNSLVKVYEDTFGGKAPDYFSDTNVVGKASFAVATYANSHTQEGFTIDIDVKLTEDAKLLEAVKVLKHDATSETFTYVFSLYVPAFTDPEGLDISLKETGAFSIVKNVECESFSINVDVETESITIQTDVDVTIGSKTKQTLDFSLTTDFDASSSTFSFTGDLSSEWKEPFGLKWMTVDSANVDLVLDSEGLNELKLSGTASLEFALASKATITIEVGGSDLENVLFSVTNVPFDALTLGLLWMDVTGATSIPSSFASMSPHGTASFYIATYDAPSAAEGFTCKVDVTIIDAGDIYKAASTLSKDVSSLTFELTLIIPVFTDITDITFDLAETGKFALTKDIEVVGYHLDVAISSHTSINIGATLSIDLKENPTPVEFSVDADWTESSSISFTGSLVGDWDHPFGAKWLEITAASVDLVVGVPAAVSSFTISGSADLTFNNDKASTSFSVHTGDDFAENAFLVTVKNMWTLSDIAESVLGKLPSDYLKDVDTSVATSLTLALSTFDYEGYLEGLTVKVSGKITGDLKTKLQKDLYWWKGLNWSDMSFSISLNIPVFSTDPADVDLSLMFSDQIQLSKHLWFEDVNFSIDVLPFSLSLNAKVKAEFDKNPTLYFIVGGEFKTNEILMYGAMEGSWVDPFGIKGFSLGDAILQIGFSPSMCAVDACISDFGIGAQMTIGHDVVKFDGNVAVPDFWDIYLAGSIEGKGDLILSVLGVVDEWNKINPAMKISTKDIPPTWGLNDVGFYFAPADGTLGPIHYTEGFGITGGITILDMALYLSINCTDNGVASCDFAFDVDISKQTFGNMIQKELHLMYPNATNVFDLFSLNSVSLNQWSQKNVAGGVNPHWAIDITALGKAHKLDFHVEQYELASNFHSFFNQWIKHIFH